MKLDEITLRKQTITGDDLLAINNLLEIATAFARTLVNEKIPLGEDWPIIKNEAEDLLTRLGAKMDRHITKVQARYERMKDKK